MKNSLRIGFIGLIILVSTASLHARTFVVDVTDDRADPSPTDGVCGLPDYVLGGPWCSLRAAIQEANLSPGEDTIVLSAATHSLSIAGVDEELSAAGDLNIYSDLVIEGNGAIIDAQQIDRIIELTSANLTISDLTLTNGHSASDGGAILAIKSTIAMDGVNIVGNQAVNDAAGIYIGGGDLIASNSRFDENMSGQAGAGIFAEQAQVTLQNVVFYSNDAEEGAAIYASNVELFELNGVDFWENSAGFYGGALMIDGASYMRGESISTARQLERSFVMDAVRFRGNEAVAGSGGGIYVDNLLVPLSAMALQISNCEFEGNHGFNGGAISVYSGDVAIADCSFENNQANGASGAGGAIFSYPEIEITNSSFTNNVAVGSGGAVYSESDIRFINSTAENNDSFSDDDYEEGVETSEVVITALDETDSDGDGILDENDNCPYIANADQSNTGGTIVGAGDEYGDACQCGDVNDNGVVDNTDAVLIIRYANALPPSVNLAKCDVNGDGLCDEGDATAIRSSLLGLSSESMQQCEAAKPPIDSSVQEGGSGDTALPGVEDAESTSSGQDQPVEVQVVIPQAFLLLLASCTLLIYRMRSRIDRSQY